MIGLTGLASLAGLELVHSLYPATYSALSKWQVLLTGARLFWTIVVLFIPTFLMGGTFPILVLRAAQKVEELPRRISQLYWTNTAGAVLGTLVAGFWLLPYLGLRLTICSAAALNCAAGIMAIRNAGTGADGARKEALASHEPDVRKSTDKGSGALLWLFGVVGCTAFAYEIAWTRLLAITIGSSTYAFTLMLATFLTGLVIGSAVFQSYASHEKKGASWAALSWVQVALGCSALSSLILFHWIPAVIPPLLNATGRTFSGLVVAQCVTTGLTVLPAAIAFGFNFPMVLALYEVRAKRRGSSAAIGKAYAANTIGSIIGSIVTGFALIPWLGSFRVIAAVAVVNLLAAVSLHLNTAPRRLAAISADALLIAGTLVVAFSSFFYNQPLLLLSTVLYGSSYQGRLTLGEIAATKEVVFATEGVNDSVAVVRTDGDVALRVNGKVDASTQDSRTQLLMGDLGAALHPSPKRVLIIGFGSGMTVSAVARYPDVQRIDCIEIEPAVIRAAPYLESLNRGVLSDSRLHMIFEDARTFLLTSRAQYDLIISEPSNPWIQGVATLFTSEYYAAARKRLAPGGMLVQWLQAYSLAPGDLQMTVRTFAPHFPEVTLWRAGETDLLLLARLDVSPIRFDHLQSLWGNAALREDFTFLDVQRPEGLVGYFLLADAAVRRLGGEGPLNTDDRTLLEYDAPKGLLTPGLAEADGELIRRFRGGPIPPNLARAEVPGALKAGLETALDLNDVSSAKDFLDAEDSQPDSVSREIAGGRLALLEGDAAHAEQHLQTALRLDPQSPEAAYWRAKAERSSGDDNAAAQHIDEALKWRPDYLPALEDEMELAAARKDFRTALTAQLRRMALMAHPPAYEYGRLGALWISAANVAEAEAALLKGLGQDPYCYACHFELGELYLETGKLSPAREHFAWVVRFFPDSDPVAFRSLVGIDLALRDQRAARSVLEEGLRLFPDDAGLREAQSGVG